VATFEFYVETAQSLDFGSPYFLCSLIGWTQNSLASDWISDCRFAGYQIKIKIICRLTKDRDQALISISTIQECYILLIPFS